jgi:hypothetical protein
VLAERQRYVASPQVHYYSDPPAIERGFKHELYDEHGRAYVDVINNVAILGHSHPAVERAATRQLRLLNTNSRFLYGALPRFARRLADLLPDPLEVVLLVSSGSEANDLALRLAHAATGARDVLCVGGNYHGWTTATFDVSTSLFDNPLGIETRPPWIHAILSPNTYRGPHRGADAGERYAADAQRALDEVRAAGRGLSALIAASLEKFSTEIRGLQRTEVREVEEPFAQGMKGSSAMPHKRNPKVAERICGLARIVRAAALVGLENVPLWHERDISQSSAERIAIPDAFLALDYMLDRFTWIVDGLVVYPERMRRNLEASHYLFFSHRLLLALIEAGLERDKAYRIVQRHAMRAWDEERDFRELVRADPEIHVDLDSVFDESAFTKHVDVVFDRLHNLVKEPVHA